MSKRRRRRAVSAALLFGRILIRITLYVLLAVFAVMLAGRAYTFGYSVFHSSAMTGQPGKDVAVTITEDMSAREIGQLLQRKELIRDANVFAVQAIIYNYKLYPGAYILNTSQDVTDMIAVMSAEPEEQPQEEKKTDTVIPTTAAEKGN